MNKKQLSLKLGVSFEDTLKRLSDRDIKRLSNLLNRPDITVRPYRQMIPIGLTISTSYGQIIVDHSLTKIESLYVNGTKFNVNDNSLNGLETLLSNEPIANIQARQFHEKRKPVRRRKVAEDKQLNVLDKQEDAYNDLKGAGITYATFYQELQTILQGRNFNPQDVFSDMLMEHVPEEDIAYYITHESPYKEYVISALYNLNYEPVYPEYNFKKVYMDDSFIGQLVARLGEMEADYDAEEGVLKIGDRYITNIPYVDENGVFHTKHSNPYIPYKIGYFADEKGTRVERLRYIDPVSNALDAVVLQYQLTKGDIRFQPLLDVTRDLPDFDKHPYGQEILDTLKRKISIDKSYIATNSLLAEHRKHADDLGAVALTMLDDDAEGLIDPYGTSNGSNMGLIFYLTQDAEFNPDGTLTKGAHKHSLVGDVMNQFGVEKDNFNRHQMSFNAMLTSRDVKKLNVAYCEFALWNSEDAVVLTDKGAKQFDKEMMTGDKIIDMHGNKSVSSLVIDSNMDAETAKMEQLEHAVEFARLNPELDLIVSPVSLNSRLNIGVGMEGLMGNKHDLVKPDGTVVPDGITEISYMALPQTAEYKSVDYGKEGRGRRYSTLFRTAFSSKVGAALYEQGIIDQASRQHNKREIVAMFERLGVSFNDNDKLLTSGNVNFHVDADVTVSADQYKFKTGQAIRLDLMTRMENGTVNIDLGDMKVYSPFNNKVIKDSQGRNVLPIRVNDGTIPFRYMDVFNNLSRGNENYLRHSFNNAAAIDYHAITRKDSVLKHIDTSVFHEGAKTEMIVPDPRIKLGQIRTSLNSDRVIAHRDPCIQSGNVISFENIGDNQPNLTHVNPLMIVQVDGDFDSDTMGVNSYDNLTLTDDQKDEMFEKSTVYAQLNRYDEVFLATGGSHFKACIKACDMDDSDINFDNNQTNQEIGDLVENKVKQILDNPKSYGAYALSFTNAQTLEDSMVRLAEEGIKGNVEDIRKHLKHGYTDEENRAVMKALIAKSEWTGLGGAITNNLIAGFGDNEFDPELTKVAMDITYSMTQSVLQMKKNADKLTYIDECITKMKTVMSGKYDVETSRDILLQITKDLAPVKAVNQFCDLVAQKGKDPEHFGRGLFNGTELTTTKLAYASTHAFNNTLINLVNGQNKTQSFQDLVDELNQMDTEIQQ